MSIKFDTDRRGTGTREWAENKLNISKGCTHDCLYCYARSYALRFRRISTRKEWRREHLTSKAFMTSFPRRQGVIMYPTSHDITPYNLYRSIAVLRLALEAGNQVLIVSKPHLECVKALVGQLVKFRSQILFRFTIGALDEDLSRLWEPGAPLPAERLESLSYAFAAGYNTSVSIEPMLAGVEETLRVVQAVTHLVSETIWVGTMRRIRERVDTCDPETARAVEIITEQQSDREVMRLAAHLQDHPKIRWKDSIKKVLLVHNCRNRYSDLSHCDRCNQHGAYA